MKALAILLFIPFEALLSQENNGRGVKAIAMANAFVAIADNPWAVSYNAAGLARIAGPQLSSFFVPQQFGIPELKTVALAGAYPSAFGTLGTCIEQFGFDLYKTTDVQLGYGIALDSLISVGATVGLEQIAIERYGSTSTVTVEVGLLGHPMKHLDIGCTAKNILAATIGRNRERLPQYLLFGVCYTLYNGFSITSEVEKDFQFPLVVKAGIEQGFLGFLFLRCGVANNPDKFSVGMAVRYSVLEFGYAGYSHPDLGWTHQVEITARWNK